MSDKRNKFNESMNIIVYTIQIITSILFIGVLFVIGSIPANYLIVAGAVLTILLLGEYFLIFTKKPNSKRSLLTKIFSLLLSIVISIASFYVYQVGRVVDLMGGTSFESRAMSVIVLKDSSIINNKHLENKRIGIITFMDKENVDYAVDDINKNIGVIRTSDYSDFAKLVNALYNKEVDAIILDEAFRTIVTADHENFDEETRVVYQITKEEESLVAKNVDVVKKPFLIYISGNDEYGQLRSVSRSDVNMLVAVNPNTKQILLVSIPRDSYYPLDRNGQYDKFTHAGIYGMDESVATLENMLDEDINYYARMNFTSFMNIIDALGGITIDVPVYKTLYSDDGSFTTRVKNPKTKEGYTIYPGINHFDAREALAFVRERKSFAEGEFVRGQNQQLMVKAIVKKVCSPAILTSFSDILETISSSVETNLSTDEINALIQLQLSEMSSWDIQTYQVSGTPTSMPCYSLGNVSASVIIPNESSLLEATDYINRLKNGELINTKID